ncbi:MAG: protein translocase subunit SecF [Gemmobacter sp.]|nr:protein translocase subunit SecF [Gemmobacter sp.]
MRRLKLVPDHTTLDFFKYQWLTLGSSVVLMIASIAVFLVMGLNFGIDFRGGTTIRSETTSPVTVAQYREAIAPLGLGDVVISEVFDPTFGDDQNVMMIRIQAQDEEASVSPEMIASVEAAIKTVDPSVTFPSVESVGPKVSGELVQSAIIAVALALVGIMIYVWLRFEWQFAVGAVAALVHDVLLTIGIFSLFQIRFDLTIVAALLTIVGYSINDTVVVFDRLRENLIKFKKMPLRDVMNLSVNETLSRTVMTSGTTLIALIALLVLGGDVIRGFVFAMTWGVVVGTYSSVFMAKNLVLYLGTKREWTKPTGEGPSGTQFSDPDK